MICDLCGDDLEDDIDCIWCADVTCHWCEGPLDFDGSCFECDNEHDKAMDPNE